MNLSAVKIIFFLIILCFEFDLGIGCDKSELCVPIKNCLSINELLYQKNLTEFEINKLRSSQCGYMNETVYVCCKSSLPKPPTCGPFSVLPRIIGGNITHINDYPWTVLVGTLVMKEDGEHIKYNCGGSLISDQYVVTAAHCIKIMSTKNVGTVATRRIRKVRLGEWDLEQEPIDIEVIDADTNRTIVGDPVIDMNIENIIVHEKYHPLLKSYDIALIKLLEKVNYTKFIKPICLPDKEQEIEDDLIVIGWGRTENMTRSNIKRYANIPKLDLSKCLEEYKNEVNVKIDSSHLCAGNIDGVDSCQGDSGGSLVGHNTSNPFKIYHYLAGIVSFGIRECGNGKLPGIYTNVKSYLKWIYQNIEHAG